MKRSLIELLIVVMALLGLTLPVIAQDVTEEDPVESLELKKGDIPSPVQKAAEKLFEGDTQIAWGSFPYELKNYGWYVNPDYKGPVDYYEIKFKAKDGSNVFAVFESTGKLIRCKIINKDAPVPQNIVAALENGEYKGWKIVGDVMLIKSNRKNIDEHYAVKVEKGGKEKTLFFAPEGKLLSAK